MKKNDNKIPSVIHYCWLGRQEKPEAIKAYKKSWEKYAPEFEIKEWNEDNFPFNEIDMPYVRDAIKDKKWAFVTDVMRLYVLFCYGGVYFDTDVELIRPFQGFQVHSSFIGFESRYSLCTAVIGAKPEENWIGELLEYYKKRNFYNESGKQDMTPNSQYIYQILNEKYDLTMSKEIIALPNGLTVYPAEYFSPINYSTMRTVVTENTYAIHHYSGAWKSSGELFKDRLKGVITRIIGEKRREQLKRIIKG